MNVQLPVYRLANVSLFGVLLCFPPPLRGLKINLRVLPTLKRGANEHCAYGARPNARRKASEGGLALVSRFAPRAVPRV
jgi:hypothetical protein